MQNGGNNYSAASVQPSPLYVACSTMMELKIFAYTTSKRFLSNFDFKIWAILMNLVAQCFEDEFNGAKIFKKVTYIRASVRGVQGVKLTPLFL